MKAGRGAAVPHGREGRSAGTPEPQGWALQACAALKHFAKLRGRRPERGAEGVEVPQPGTPNLLVLSSYLRAWGPPVCFLAAPPPVFLPVATVKAQGEPPLWGMG